MAKKDRPQRDTVKFTTPRGVWAYPKLHKPDTRYKPEGVYEVKNIIDPKGKFLINNGKDTATLEEIYELLDGLLERTMKKERARLSEIAKGSDKKKAKKAQSALDGLTKRDAVFKAHEDDDGNETDKLEIKATMKASGEKADGTVWTRKPDIFDAGGNPLKKVPAIFGGTEGKVAVEAAGYYVPPKEGNAAVVGVAFYLDGVQILKLVKGGERSASSYGFGKEEGYEDDGGPADDDEDEDEDESDSKSKAGAGGAADDDEDF